MFAARRARRVRSDVSLVTDVLAALTASRVAGAPIPVDQLPVVIGLVNLYADVLADMPPRPVRRHSHPLPILEQPNPEESRRATTHKLVQSAIKTGNGYVLDERRGSVTVLDPTMVTHVYDDLDPLRIKSWIVNGMPYQRHEVHHFKINDDPRRGPLGRSPFADAREPLDMYGHAYRYLTDFFAGGGNPSTVLQRTGVGNNAYTNEDAAEDWIAARQARRPAVLPAGWELSVPVNNGELEAIGRMLENSAAEVARLLNAPPSLVNVASKGSMTYTNTDGEFRRWLATSLGPTWIGRLEDLWSAIAGEPVELDTAPLFKIVDPTSSNSGQPTQQTGTPPRLEAVS
jgi:phage portal protein BeeE